MTTPWAACDREEAREPTFTLRVSISTIDRGLHEFEHF